MENQKKLSIVILTWNGLDYTKLCLDSIKDSVFSFGAKVYVADNGSTDGTVEYLKGLDWITLVENGENLGFVRGNNVVINQIAEGDILLLNNDMIIEQPDWLDKLQRCAYEDDKTGIVGCRLINEKNHLLHVGTYIYPETCWGQQIGGDVIGVRQPDYNQYNTTREVQGVVFACAYIKREVIDKIGGLNEAFFSYFEDTDYCLRAKEAGFNTVCCGDVTLIHYQNVSTSVNKVSFNDMFLKSQETFRGLWADKLSSRYESQLAFRTVLSASSGYALSAKNFILSLDKKNVDIRYKYAYGPGTPIERDEPENDQDYIANIIKHREFSKDCPQIVYAQGDAFYQNDGTYKIGYTMLEPTGIPKEWVKQCNEMDEVWVPSSFNVKTFTDSGVTKPIHVIPLGVDPNFYHPEVRSIKKHRLYTFLSVFEWGERKAPELLLKAYTEAFRHNKDVLLLCKVNNHDPGLNVGARLNELGLPADGPRIIFLYNQDIPECEMPMLYKSADCFVLPSRGEGWGMPILEAMACGLPVIATNWSAQTDFYNDKVGYPVDVEKLIDAKAKCPYYEGYQWAEPSFEHLIHQMRYVYENRDEAKAMGLRASKEALTNWTWDQATDKMLERIRQL